MANDSTAMTIDFLRARLLSERSVSRASRERADQLAQRVVELEEQLRIVTNQRKKAEKAAAEVLSILESQGVGYFTEPEGIDSSSDLDEVEEGEPTTTVTKEWECDGTSVNSHSNSKDKDETSKSNGSTVERSEVEDAVSGSEVDGQVVAGRLSWKGRSKSPDSHRKNKAGKHLRNIRPRHIFYFTSPDPSPKYQKGKSCRKIKPKDLRSHSEDEGMERRCSDGNDKGEGISDKTEDERMGFYAEVSRGGNEMRRDVEKEGQMERALEEQAQLIDQFRAEENAQREWEKMYSQNRTVPKEDLKSENKASIGESICDDKEDIADYRSNKTDTHEEENTSPENLFSTEFSSITTSARENTDMTYEKAIAAVLDGDDHSNASSAENCLFKESRSEIFDIEKVESVPDDSTVTTRKEGPDRSVVIVHSQDCESSEKGSTCNKKEIINIPNSPSSQSSLSNSSPTHEENPLALQLYVPPTESSNGGSCSAVEEVLESLRRAKMSLRENLSRKLPSCDRQLLAITDRAHEEMDCYPTIRGSVPLDTRSVNIPVGSSSGLFRLPTDALPKPGISNNFLSLEYPNNLTNRLPINSLGAATEDYLGTKLFLDPQSALMAVPGSSFRSYMYASGSSSNFTPQLASLHSRVPGFYEDLRRTLPAGDRLFFYGGDSFSSDLRTL
ncbi:transcriptional regulator ATRX [Rhynchospora pubera]|uniref:Transcriptional regulator ATRX n=1 Tax=Rhynchospora pubera TaxID=906938 RepID=A0AAV8CVW4_9POAL|nr:transcriptional regulator ATRX [Rhynchospora pubera]